MLFKTTGKSSSILLKIKRDKLREDRFKEIQAVTRSKTEEKLIKKY
jgi:hypothetical protein